MGIYQLRSFVALAKVGHLPGTAEKLHLRQLAGSALGPVWSSSGLVPIAIRTIAPVAAVHYNRGMMFVRFVGTHREYDKIDVETI